jgi:hypothetical protein
MKHLKLLALSASILSMISTLVSCGDNDVDMNFSIGYTTSIADETISADKQELYITVSPLNGSEYKDASNWKFFQIADSLYPEKDGWVFGRDVDVITNNGKKVSHDGWIDMENITINGINYLHLNISENIGDARAVRITFANFEGYPMLKGGQVIIRQEAAPDYSTFEAKARYKDKLYTSTAHHDKDGTIVYDDESFSSLMSYLDELDAVEVFVTGDCIVNYFDSEDIENNPQVNKMIRKIDTSAMQQLNALKLNNFSSRSDSNSEYGQEIASCELYDDSDFSDTSAKKSLTELTDIWDVTNLKQLNLNDKISSLIVKYNITDENLCAILTIWEDSDFNHGDSDRTKHRINFIANKYTPKTTAKLKDLHCIGSRNTWNDRISSSSFHIGYNGINLKEY